MGPVAATLVALPASLIIGHSAGGRPIEAIHVGGAGPVVLVVGCIHGNECAALPVVAQLERERPAHEDLWVIPEANPDGTAADTRGNADGVDLNRNFPDGWAPGVRGELQYPGPRPASEPETRALEAFIRRIRPRITIWFHQPQTLVRAWGSSAAVARRYAARVGLKYVSLRWPNGAATHWQNALGERSFVVELAPRPLSAAGVDRHVRAVLDATR